MSSYEIEKCTNCGIETFVGDTDAEYARGNRPDAFAVDGKTVCPECFKKLAPEDQVRR